MSDRGGRWVPLLEGADAERARAAADAITADLGKLDVEPGLYHGRAGVALLHGYRARCGDPDGAAAAADALSAAAEMFAEERAPWLGTGFSGVAFAIAHLADVVETEPDTLPDLDEAITNVVDRDPWPFPWELMIGLVGLGVYGLERAASPGGRSIVERTAGHLAALAERSPAGAAWRVNGPPYPDDLVAQNPGGFHSLGFAYGSTGVVAFLAAARAIGVTGGDPTLLADSVGWLRALDRPASVHRFPGYLADGWDDDSIVSRGWCAGDLAVGTVLAAAGLAAGEPAWVDHAIAVAARGAAAGHTEGDLSFCHGAVGHGHLLNRLAQATGSSELSDLARAAYQRALAAWVPGTGIGGFSRISRGLKTAEPRFAAGLQLGATGVALGLLAACSPVPPDWDRAFLVAI